MSNVVAEPAEVTVLYAGFFAEPVFGVLGNPAKLYTNLLRHLASLGASVNRLSINVSVLTEANVTCGLESGEVRVWLDRLEVLVKNIESYGKMKAAVERAWTVMSETDESLRPIKHRVTLIAWARLKDETFESYIRRFLTAPPDAPSWKPKLEFDEIGMDGVFVSSIRLEEAVGLPDGLFVRSVVDLGAAAPDIEQLASAFDEKLRAQLRRVGVELARTD